MYCDENCSTTSPNGTNVWCKTHSREYLLPLWKVTVRGDTADNAFGNLFSDDLFFLTNRVSPIVVYAHMTYASAIEMAQNPDFEVVRANQDWRI